MSSFKEIRSVHYEDNGISRLTFSWIPHQEAFAMHWHDRLEILYILRGELHLDMDEEHYVACPGQTVIIAPLVNHYGVAGEEGVSYEVITFDIVKFKNALRASEEYLSPLIEHRTYFSPVTDHPKVTSAIQELILLLDSFKTLNPLISVGKLYEIIGLLYQHCWIHTSVAHKKADESFTEVLEYIKQHFLEDITTKDISQKFGYENTYFCRKFKAVTGMTVMEHIRVLKLTMARDMLTYSDDSIKNIAWKCGFARTSHLSTRFKEYFGITPAEHRKKTKRQ